MSYQVLARKWRPQAFDDVSGQSHVTTPLRNAIRTDRVPHAILLTGPRGVGKTTLARILARCLNCEKGPTDAPCGECSACIEIAGGNSTDVQEIDAASRTSVDDVRELIEAVRYAPSPGKHRIFVVDEVHMLSTAAFNALLKTLEEPPPRSLFIFATTNPEKIPFTVVSRCQRFDLRRIAAGEIADRMRLIAKAEKLTISDKSLLAIAREADGSMRDAQTLLDQVIAHGGAEVHDDQVAEILDLIDHRLLLAIVEACVAGEAASALEACSRALESGVDAKRLGENLLQLLRDLVVLRIAPDVEQLVEGSEDDVAELRALAERTDATRLRRMFRALLKEQEDLAWAPTPGAVLELAVVRLATLPAGDDVGRLLTRLDALERRLGGSGGPPAGGGGAGGERSGSEKPGSRATRRGRGAAPAARAAPASEKAGAPSPDPSPDPDPAAAAANDEPAAAPGPDAPLEVVFERLRAAAARRDRAFHAALDGGRLAARRDDLLRIELPNRFAAKRMRDRLPAFEELCESFFGRPVRIEIETQGADAAASGGNGAASARRLRQAALEHPAINAVLEILEGEIVEIRPLGGPR